MAELMADESDDTLHLPLVEEALSVDKVAVVSDRVRVVTSVETRDVVAEETLERGVLRVERVATERAVDAAPPPREEGDTLIVSLVEERLVVEKRLFVVEEIHVTRERESEHVSVPVTLRATRASVERPLDEASTGSLTNG